MSLSYSQELLSSSITSPLPNSLLESALCHSAGMCTSSKVNILIPWFHLLMTVSG